MSDMDWRDHYKPTAQFSISAVLPFYSLSFCLFAALQNECGEQTRKEKRLSVSACDRSELKGH